MASLVKNLARKGQGGQVIHMKEEDGEGFREPKVGRVIGIYIYDINIWMYVYVYTDTLTYYRYMYFVVCLKDLWGSSFRIHSKGARLSRHIVSVIL